LKPVHPSAFGAKGSKASHLTRRPNLGWAGLVLLSALVGLLSAGYALGLLGDWAELRPSLTKIVTSSAGDGNTEVSGEPGSIDSGVRLFEASRFLERERADISGRASVDAPGETPANPPAEASKRAQVERLIKLMEQSEATWAEGYKAERERADGIARELASVRAELVNRAAAEAALRAEVARMGKLLAAAGWTKKLAADQKKSKGVVKDSASMRAELADRAAAAEAFARAANEATTNITTGSAMTDRLETDAMPDPVQTTTMDQGGASTFAARFGFQSSPTASMQVSSSTGMAKRERRMRKPANGTTRQTRAIGTETPTARSP